MNDALHDHPKQAHREHVPAGCASGLYCVRCGKRLMDVPRVDSHNQLMAMVEQWTRPLPLAELGLELPGVPCVAA